MNNFGEKTHFLKNVWELKVVQATSKVVFNTLNSVPIHLFSLLS